MAPTRGLLSGSSCAFGHFAPAFQTLNLGFRRTYTRESEILRAKSRSPKYIKKVEDAEKSWDDRAAMIQRGEAQNVWDMLEERGFIKHVAGCVLSWSTQLQPHDN